MWELTAAQWWEIFSGVGSWAVTPALVLACYTFCWKLERRVLRMEYKGEFERRKPDDDGKPGTWEPKRRSDFLIRRKL